MVTAPTSVQVSDHGTSQTSFTGHHWAPVSAITELADGHARQLCWLSSPAESARERTRERLQGELMLLQLPCPSARGWTREMLKDKLLNQPLCRSARGWTRGVLKAPQGHCFAAHQTPDGCVHLSSAQTFWRRANSDLPASLSMAENTAVVALLTWKTKPFLRQLGSPRHSFPKTVRNSAHACDAESPTTRPNHCDVEIQRACPQTAASSPRSLENVSKSLKIWVPLEISRAPAIGTSKDDVRVGLLPLHVDDPELGLAVSPKGALPLHESEAGPERLLRCLVTSLLLVLSGRCRALALPDEFLGSPASSSHLPLSPIKTRRARFPLRPIPATNHHVFLQHFLVQLEKTEIGCQRRDDAPSFPDHGNEPSAVVTSQPPLCASHAHGSRSRPAKRSQTDTRDALFRWPSPTARSARG